MRRLFNLLFFALLSVPAAAQAPDSLRQLIDSLEAGTLQTGVAPEYADAERFADSIRLKQEEKEKLAQKQYNDRASVIAYTIISCGAVIFCIWAALYKKRYREQFTVNGRYIGIGSKYYHDHFETDHWDPAHPGGGRWGVRPQDDPWCVQEYEAHERRMRELRREQARRSGGGASTQW